ncbi:hypothetical protein [Methanobacterium sp. ACI-7]
MKANKNSVFDTSKSKISKAILLRVGIDKGTDGCLAPIFEDLSFE